MIDQRVVKISSSFASEGKRDILEGSMGGLSSVRVSAHCRIHGVSNFVVSFAKYFDARDWLTNPVNVTIDIILRCVTRCVPRWNSSAVYRTVLNITTLLYVYTRFPSHYLYHRGMS